MAKEETALNGYSRTLSDAFKKKYVKRMGNKDFVEYNGLLALAKAEPDFSHINAWITQYPCAENKFTTFARAEVYNKDGKLVGMEEGDANVQNCNKMVGVHAPRMALTRAKGRALRDYLGIDMVTQDEILLYQPDLASSKTIGAIKRAAKAGKVRDEKLYTWLEAETGEEEFNDLTEDLAQSFLAYVQGRVEKAEKKRREREAEENDEEEMMELD